MQTKMHTTSANKECKQNRIQQYTQMQTNNATQKAIINAHRELKQTMQTRKQTNTHTTNANKESKQRMQTKNAQTNANINASKQ